MEIKFMRTFYFDNKDRDIKDENTFKIEFTDDTKVVFTGKFEVKETLITLTNVWPVFNWLVSEGGYYVSEICQEHYITEIYLRSLISWIKKNLNGITESSVYVQLCDLKNLMESIFQNEATMLHGRITFQVIDC